MTGRRRLLESGFFGVCRSCSHLFILILWIPHSYISTAANVISQRLNRRDYMTDMTYIFPPPLSRPRKKASFCRSCSQIKKGWRHDLHSRARQAFSWAPRAAASRPKNNDYMTDMTDILAPGPGLVCHPVCKYQAGITNTWARQLQAFAPWARTW